MNLLQSKIRATLLLTLPFILPLATLITYAQEDEPTPTQQATTAEEPASFQKFPAQELRYALGQNLQVPSVFSAKVPESVSHLQSMQAHQNELAEQLRQATCAISLNGAAGSGVFISANGLIASAAHVTGAPGTEFVVFLTDGTKLDAICLSAETEIDGSLACILPGQLDQHLPWVDLAKEDSASIGDWCLAAGNAGGWDSQRGSIVRVGRLVRLTEEEYQSDTILIGGDSGGPLIDITGKLLGTNSKVGATARHSLHVPLSYFYSAMPEALERRELLENEGLRALLATLPPVISQDFQRFYHSKFPEDFSLLESIEASSEQN